jgi:hypothetical protein
VFDRKLYADERGFSDRDFRPKIAFIRVQFNRLPMPMMARLTTPRARRWVADERPARVLHLFDDVCNLVSDRGEVLSLVGSVIGPGPFAVTLDGGFTAGLNAAMPVAVDGLRQTVTVGPLTIEATGAADWSPVPEWKRLRDLDPTAWLPGATLSPHIVASLRKTVGGILAGDPGQCVVGAAELAGRGSGLTPTGDDVLMGVLFALWVWQPGSMWPALIARAAAPRTTTLSANFIRAAAAGEAVWQWHDLTRGDPSAVERILEIGHSSGADAWTGFVHTIGALRA